MKSRKVQEWATGHGPDSSVPTLLVKSSQDDCHHEGFKKRPRETATDGTNTSQSTKTGGVDFGNMALHSKIAVQLNTEVLN
jgi:hypothetical protein